MDQSSAPRPHRVFSGSNITLMVVAICAVLILAPVSVAAATGSLVNITDPVTSSYKARVTSKGGLAVTPRDASTGAQQKVDSTGHALVATVPAVPALPFQVTFQASVSGTPMDYIPMTAGKTLAITDIVIGHLGSNQSYGAIAAVQADDAACTTNAGELPSVTEMPAGTDTTVSAHFSTPLRIGPAPAGKYRCLLLNGVTSGTDSVLFTVTGFYY